MSNKFISALPAAATLTVGAASFALSYVALSEVADEVGAVPGYMAWLVPIVIDGGIIAGSAVIWDQARRGGSRQIFPFLFVAALVIVSVIVNVNHADPTLLAQSIAALPPLVLLGSLEIVAASHRRNHETDGTAAAATPSSAAPDPDMRPAQAPARPATPARAPATPATRPSVAPASSTWTVATPAVVQPDPTPAGLHEPAAEPVERAEPHTSVPSPAQHGTATPAHTPSAHQLADRPAPAPEPAPEPASASTAVGAVAADAASRPAADGLQPAVTDEPAAVPTRPVEQRSEQTESQASGHTTEGEHDLLAGLLADVDGDVPVKEAVVEVFTRYLQAGGDPYDKQLTGRLAAHFGSKANYIANIIRPYRANSTPAG